MPDLYWCGNGAMPTTAAMPPVATGTAIKTLLQIATPSTRRIKIVEWGISFDGSAAGTPGRCELIETDIAATVTAHLAAGVQSFNHTTPSLVVLGASATGFTASAEGSTTTTRYADYQLIAPTNQYVKQWPQDNEFVVAASKFLRVRVTFAISYNATTYIVWKEG